MSALWACCEVAVTWYAREEETCSLVEKLHSSRCKVTKRVRWLWWAFMVCDPCLGFASLCGKLNTMVESILATGNKVYIVSSPKVCTSWPDLFTTPHLSFCIVSYFDAPSRSLRWRLARGVMAWDSHWIYPGACDAFLKQKWTFTNLNSCFFRERSSHSKKKNDGLSLSAVSILPDAHTIILQCTFITVSFFFWEIHTVRYSSTCFCSHLTSFIQANLYITIRVAFTSHVRSN